MKYRNTNQLIAISRLRQEMENRSKTIDFSSKHRNTGQKNNRYRDTGKVQPLLPLQRIAGIWLNKLHAILLDPCLLVFTFSN